MLSDETGTSEVSTATDRSSYYDELAEFSAALETGSPVQCNADEAIRAIRGCWQLVSLFDGEKSVAQGNLQVSQ